MTATASCVSAARARARSVLDTWGISAEVGDDVLLIVSELVTNAITHTASQDVLCRLRADTRGFRIEVEDQSQAGRVPEQRAADPHSQCGRGLILVDALARTWGVTTAARGPGHLVWAELPLSAPQERPRPAHHP
ncbi:ATP-binding protein [Streptomyces sp. G45]|uniref:ATP-binding protein n=1 Tax=Streptomyces sp. G45 TaxID=3406627 RepID=UPI003C25DA22